MKVSKYLILKDNQPSPTTEPLFFLFGVRFRSYPHVDLCDR